MYQNSSPGVRMTMRVGESLVTLTLKIAAKPPPPPSAPQALSPPERSDTQPAADRRPQPSARRAVNLSRHNPSTQPASPADPPPLVLTHHFPPASGGTIKWWREPSGPQGRQTYEPYEKRTALRPLFHSLPLHFILNPAMIFHIICKSKDGKKLRMNL